MQVDSIAEGSDTVGVEWHVQCGDAAFPLGRGLSQARVCTRTGKIERVVDIAEAVRAPNRSNAMLHTDRTDCMPLSSFVPFLILVLCVVLAAVARYRLIGVTVHQCGAADFHRLRVRTGGCW